MAGPLRGLALEYLSIDARSFPVARAAFERPDLDVPAFLEHADAFRSPPVGVRAGWLEAASPRRVGGAVRGGIAGTYRRAQCLSRPRKHRRLPLALPTIHDAVRAYPKTVSTAPLLEMRVQRGCRPPRFEKYSSTAFLAPCQ